MAGCREAGDTDCISPANLALSPGTLLPPPHSNMFSAKACIKPVTMVGCCHLTLLSGQSRAGAFSITRVTVAESNKRQQDSTHKSVAADGTQHCCQIAVEVCWVLPAHMYQEDCCTYKRPCT